MAFNKTKEIAAAQALVAQGKLKEAIRAYQRIHKYDAKDQNVLNILGDLHVRGNKLAEALEYYTKLGDLYANEGFLVRAIAMYKKIYKLETSNTHALERLAELYTMQGMLGDARAQYLELAEAYVKGNQGPQAMEVMRKVLDLDPDNIKIQERLAHLYENHGQGAEAAAIYRRLAERLLAEDRVDEGRKWLQKAAALAPDDLDGLLMQARAQQQGGDFAKSLETLKKVPQAEENAAALELLLNARVGTGDVGGAGELAEKLFAADPSRFGGILQLARHAADHGDPTSAQAWLEQVADSALQYDPPALVEAARAVAAASPEATGALELMARAARAAQDTEALADALYRQGQLAERSEDFTGAKHLYDELVRLDPGTPEFTQALNRMREQLGEPAITAEAHVEAAAAAAPAAGPELDEETQAYVNSTITDIDLFSSYGMTDKAVELAEQLVGRIPNHVPGNEKLLDLYLGSGNDRGVVEVARRLETLHRKVENQSRAEELASLAARYAAKVGEEAPAEAATTPPPPEEAPAAVEQVPAAEASTVETPTSEVHEVDLSAEWAVSATPEEPVLPTLEPQPEAPAAFDASEANREIDFFLGQRFFDQARDAVSRYEEQFPGDPGVAELRERVESAAAEPAEAGGAVHEVLLESTAQPAEAAPVGAEEEEGQAYEVVLEEQPREEAPAAAPAGMSAGDFFSDLAGDLDAALADKQVPTAAAGKAAPPPPPASKAAPPAAKAAEPPTGVLAEVFQEFKSEMGEVEEVEDTESHYNLGIAYKEMGLLDEAISEFQKVSKAAEKTQDVGQFFQCCTLLGLCFLDKGLPQIAVRWYERALKTPGIDEEAVLALRYDMGTAHEQAGNRKAALDCFMEVYGANVDYRDVGERIRELQGA